MKIILYCAPRGAEPLTQVIKAAGHIAVIAASTPEDLIYAIAQHTPHKFVAELSHVIASPQALSLVLNFYPDLPSFNSYVGKSGWEADLREFLSRPLPEQRPPPYAGSDRSIFHDASLREVASGKLRCPDYAAADWRSKCLRQEARFILQLQSGRHNQAVALRYYRCLQAQQRGRDLELGYRLVHGSYKALSWSRELAGRWLALLCHYVPGAELEYLPFPMTPGPSVDFVHRDPPPEALYAITLLLHFGMPAPIAAEIKFLAGANFEEQPETELFQISLRLYGMAKLLQKVCEAQVRLMTRWMDPEWVQNDSDRTYRRHLGTYRDFWGLEYIIQSPRPLGDILGGFHAGKTRVLLPELALKFQDMPQILPENPQE